MSSPQMPPWLQEQIMKLQQTQQSLQSIMTQKQHLEIEKAETTKALEELKKIADGDAVFKQAIFFNSSRAFVVSAFSISRCCF